MNQIQYNRTKVVCTMGPATAPPEVLRQLILAGMDVARLNFSHGSHEDHMSFITKIRALNAEMGTHIALLQDLQGPKMRVGGLDAPFQIAPGDIVYLSTQAKVQEGNVLPIQFDGFAADVKAGDLVLVDDGKVELTVLETDGHDRVKLEVRHGDAIGSKKGVNLPYTALSIPSISPKDLEDVAFGIQAGVDWIALSFVRSAREIKQLKKIIADGGSAARVIAKVEKPEALKNIDEIIEAADGIMVARGDLGVEIPMEDVPLWQKIIVKKSNRAAKPVIVATQMMESMITNRRPTRAETTDVANAVIDGADAVMLSGETSVGKYPVEVVRSMQKIIASMETLDEIYYRDLEADPLSPTWIHDSVNVTACKLAKDTRASALVGMTVSGYTAFQLSRCRPRAHVFIFTPRRDVIPILNLVWGVRAFHYDQEEGTDQTIADTLQILRSRGLLKRGDIVINTASMPLNARQRTNMLKISVVE